MFCLESKVSGSCISPFWIPKMVCVEDSKWLGVGVCHMGCLLGIWKRDCLCLALIVVGFEMETGLG